jgi:hypothetical protein
MSWYCGNGPNKGNYHCTCEMDDPNGKCCFCKKPIARKYCQIQSREQAWSQEQPEEGDQPFRTVQFQGQGLRYDILATNIYWTSPDKAKSEEECEDDGSEENIDV